MCDCDRDVLLRQIFSMNQLIRFTKPLWMIWSVCAHMSVLTQIVPKCHGLLNEYIVLLWRLSSFWHLKPTIPIYCNCMKKCNQHIKKIISISRFLFHGWNKFGTTWGQVNNDRISNFLENYLPLEIFLLIIFSCVSYPNAALERVTSLFQWLIIWAISLPTSWILQPTTWF